MSYISRLRKKRRVIPDGLWIKCVSCKEIIYAKKLSEGNKTCPTCGHLYRLSGRERLDLLCDTDSFQEIDASMTPGDPLKFVDGAPYPDKQVRAKKKSGENEAVITGLAMIEGVQCTLGIMDFSYMGGSMGSVVGERFLKAATMALEEKIPFICFSASGGARMQEALFSLMQMAKTSAVLVTLAKNKIPYISVLTDPTMGGVSASFAMLGDVHIAEPKALIGFAGPRVIEQTIRQKLPEGFQRSEFLREHGMVDIVVERIRMKDVIASSLRFMNSPQ